MISVSHCLILAAVLFSLGVLGVFVRRNVIVIFMCIEMMLNAVNLSFIAFARQNNVLDGQVLVLFVMTVAAAEVAVGLALVVAIFRNRATVYVDDLNILKW